MYHTIQLVYVRYYVIHRVESFSRQSLFYAADRSPMVTKTDALSTLISLIGEQWLGGVVNMKNWTDVWLLEGSLLHLRHLMIEKAHNWHDTLYICDIHICVFRIFLLIHLHLLILLPLKTVFHLFQRTDSRKMRF